MAESRSLLVTCEHASNHVPAEWRHLLRGQGELLESHQGWDIGAGNLAGFLSRRLGAPLYLGTITRLLVDLNRSPDNRGRFSRFTRGLEPGSHERLLADHYEPYRRAVVASVERAVRSGPVLHLSVHSFTPVLDGRTRATDVGLLFDPARPAESALARAWQNMLRDETGLRVRLNYPYRGVQDGFTSWLRHRHAAPSYVGLELELNQRLARGGRFPRALASAIAASLARAMAHERG